MLAFLARLGSRSYFVAGLVTSLVMFGRGCANEVVCVAGECDEPDTCGDAEPSTCPDPLLAFDPKLENIGALVPGQKDVGTAIAGRVDAFAEQTACESVVIGLQLSGQCSKIGNEVEIDVLRDIDEEPSYTTIAIDLSKAEQSPTVGVGVLTVPFPSLHECGERPIVVVRIRNTSTCIAVGEMICGGNSFRIDSESHAPLGMHAYVGLADCHHTSS